MAPDGPVDAERRRKRRSKRRADGTLRPAVRRRRARDRRARLTPEQQAERQAERDAWLERFEPGARTRFFKHSRARLGDAIYLRAFARQLDLPQEEAAPLLERVADERGWMKLRTKDGMVVGIAAPKTKPQT